MFVLLVVTWVALLLLLVLLYCENENVEVPNDMFTPSCCGGGGGRKGEKKESLGKSSSPSVSIVDLFGLVLYSLSYSRKRTKHALSREILSVRSAASRELWSDFLAVVVAHGQTEEFSFPLFTLFTVTLATYTIYTTNRNKR